jgi:hypothetical protein
MKDKDTRLIWEALTTEAINFRDVDAFNHAYDQFEQMVGGTMEAMPKHIVKLAQSQPPRYYVRGPEQTLKFWPAAKMDISSGEEKGPGYVMMVIERLGGYPDSGFVITDVDVELIADWWKTKFEEMRTAGPV